MPECPTCNTNKYVDTIQPDQGIFCCIHCGAEFIEPSEDDNDDTRLDTRLALRWEILLGNAPGTEETQVGSDKPEFGKVVDDTDPNNPKELP